MVIDERKGRKPAGRFDNDIEAGHGFSIGSEHREISHHFNIEVLEDNP